MKKRRSNRNQTKYQLKLKENTVYSIAAILLFSLAALTMVSFIRQGLLLIKLNDILISSIGLVSTMLVAVPLSLSGLLVTKTKAAIARPHVFVGSIIIQIALMSLIHDGWIGLEIWKNFAIFIGTIGSALFFITGILIGIVIMLNIPFEEIIGTLLSLFKSRPSHKSDIEKVKILNNNPNKSSIPKPNLVDAIKKPFELRGMGQNQTKTSSSPNTTPPLPRSASDSPWVYPPVSLLSEINSGKADRGNVKANAATIENTLEAFGIVAKVVEVNLGPAVTQYALEVSLGTKLSKISSLASDLALALAAPTGQIRIEAPIPGRSLVGIEVPNKSPEFVSLKKMFESDLIKNHKSKLAVALGLDVSGSQVVGDIAKMPHVLIAGSTGSGKSACINSFLCSLLMRNSPQELNLILVDPKRVELTGYNGIPHLLTPAIVEPEKVLSALKWATVEMERRYKLFAEVGVRNLEGYNDQAGFQALPNIVIFIDELADIMLYAQAEVEETIIRIAQMARATGIHLVLATQRPSVDIVTGLIKANIPTRIAFAVSSMVDSKVILDGSGAEKLLGKGDMLFVPPDQAKPTRIQGAFVSDKEIKGIIDFIKKEGIGPNYSDEVISIPVPTKKGSRSSGIISGSMVGEKDNLFADALRVIVQNQAASSSFLQRKLSIGYARAARILDELQEAGAVGPADGAKARDILVQDVERFLNPQSS